MTCAWRVGEARVWAGVLSACAGGAWTAPANGNPANEKSLDVVHVRASNSGSLTGAHGEPNAFNLAEIRGLISPESLKRWFTLMLNACMKRMTVFEALQTRINRSGDM